MSRIGNKHIVVPSDVTVTISGEVISVKGPKGSLDVLMNKGITAHLDGTDLYFTRANEQKQTKQNHGTTRANVNNAVIGVSKGFTKVLEMKGIGYKATLEGKNVVINAGYSHPVTIEPMEGVVISLPNATDIQVEGINKQAVGQTAALIRGVRPPEPYLGKGIRYKDEHVVTKEGKRAGAAG